MKALTVFVDQQKTGSLTQTAHECVFHYDTVDESAFVSLTMPVRAKTYSLPKLLPIFEMQQMKRNILWLTLSVMTLGSEASDTFSQAQQAFDDKRYDQANQLATQAFQQAVENREQGKALTLLGLSLYAQGNWYASAQALQGALAQDSNQLQAKEILSLVLKKLPKSLVRTLDSDKVGDRFEGSVSDWDEAQLDWETKDTLSEQTGKPLYQVPSREPAPKTIDMTTAVLQQNAQDQRQDWVLAGEMRDKQKDKQQFYQRLFSLEAGFAVVQDRPQPIEGVTPW